MTAYEMFKELDFTKSKPLLYVKEDFGFRWELVFYKIYQSYEFRICFDDDEGLNYKPTHIEKYLHKAITKKMEELGWLNNQQ